MFTGDFLQLYIEDACRLQDHQGSYPVEGDQAETTVSSTESSSSEISSFRSRDGHAKPTNPGLET